MPGQEAIVLPIIIDPKAGVAGLRAIGDEAVRTDAKMRSLSSGGGLGKVSDGLKGLARNFLQLNPLISIATGFLTSYVTGLFGAKEETAELTAEQKRLADIQRSVSEELGKEVAQVSKLKAAIESEVTSRKQKERAIAALKKINPDYFSDLKIEEGLVNKLNTAYGNYIRSITTRAELNILQKQLEDVSVTIVDLERQGAKAKIFSPELTRTLDGQLRMNKAITKEEAEQNKLNIPYNNALAVRDKILADILNKQQGVTDTIPEIKIKAKKAKIEAKEYDLSDFLFRRAVKIKAEPEEEPENIKNLSALFKPVGETDTFKRYQEGIKQVRIELEALRATQHRIADDVSSVLTPAFDSFIDAIISGEPPLKAFFQSIGNSIVNLTKKIIEAIIQAAILSAISGGAAGGGFSFKTAFKKIIGFASGGLVTGPVSALVGEGSGTNRSNPEVVAPLDRLKYFFNNMMTDNRGFGVGNMGTANATLNVPQRVMLYADGRALKGIMTLETSSQRRTG
jgi:hypothetical protein